MKKNYWNYRVLKHENYYAIHEVYYDGEKPTSWSEEPDCISNENIADIWDILKKMETAFYKPVLIIEGDKLRESNQSAIVFVAHERNGIPQIESAKQATTNLQTISEEK